jgi:uncharacterized protein (DUF4415 family)
MAAEKPETVSDIDNPEWTEADFAKARPAEEVMPPEFMKAWKRGQEQPGQ